MKTLSLIFFACFLQSCTLPVGTRKITAWGVGCIPAGGFCLPIIGYWYSEHGEDTDKYKPAPPPIVEYYFEAPGPIEPIEPTLEKRWL
jgi:hypothetical protein